MRLTSELIHSAGSNGMGFNSAQLRLLGIYWPPKKGWIRALEGKEISNSTWEQVIRLRGVRRKEERLRVLQNEKYLPFHF